MTKFIYFFSIVTLFYSQTSEFKSVCHELSLFDYQYTIQTHSDYDELFFLKDIRRYNDRVSQKNETRKREGKGLLKLKSYSFLKPFTSNIKNWKSASFKSNFHKNQFYSYITLHKITYQNEAHASVVYDQFSMLTNVEREDLRKASWTYIRSKNAVYFIFGLYGYQDELKKFKLKLLDIENKRP